METSRRYLNAAAGRRRSQLQRRRIRGLAWVIILLGVWVWLSLRPLDIREDAQAVTLDAALEVSTTVLSDSVRFYPRSAGRGLPVGTPLRLTLATPAGPYVWRGVSDDYIELPYVRAGVTPFKLVAAGQSVRGTFTKLPGTPVTPLELNVGPRVARVTGDRLPALVLHPLDSNQNVTLDPVTVSALYPSGELWQRSVRVDKLIAWTLLPAGNRVGKLKVSATTAAKRGERADVDLVPGRLGQARFAAAVDTVTASGRDTWQLELANSRDLLGNVVGDGTAVSFVGAGSSTSNKSLDFFLTRPLIQGGQPLSLPPYPEAGNYELQLVSDVYASQALKLTALPLAPERLELRLSPDKKRLLLGPVLSQTGALVDNGTRVNVSAFDAQGVLLNLSLPLQTGELEWNLPPLPPGTLGIEACVGERCERVELAQ